MDGPRRNLDAAFVRSLLQSHTSIQITYGAVALDSEFTEVADIAGYMQTGSSISSNIADTTQRTCSLNIDSDVTDTGWSYLSGFVKPYMVITDANTLASARFNLGVYTLTSPDRILGTTPTQLSFAGYDLTYLLRQNIGDSYEVAAGTDPAQAAADVIGLAVPGAVVQFAASGSTLPAQMSWPFDAENPVTFYEIISALLNTIGYRAVWVDWEGNFRVQPFVDLQASAYEWVFDTLDPANIVAEGGTQSVDLYDVPNWWRFVMADLTVSPVEGLTQFTWEDASATNPGSTQNRGRTQKKIISVTAATYTDLVNYAQRMIVADLAPAEQFSVKTQPFPIAWHMDVLQYREDTLIEALPLSAGTSRRVVATQWTLPLDGQSDMDWTWQTVSDQTAALGLTVLNV